MSLHRYVAGGVLVAALASACQVDRPTAPETEQPTLKLGKTGKPRPPKSGAVEVRFRKESVNRIAPGARNGQQKGNGKGAWTTAGPNVVTNQDHTFLPQNEPAIAVDPDHPNRLVASSNDYRFALESDSKCGAYASTDGGKSWHDVGNGTMPLPLIAGSDPSVAFAPNGDAYWACVAFERETFASALVVAKSSDLTSITTFSPLTSTPNGNEVFNDKPYMTIDRGQRSPFLGRIYVTWTHFDATGSPIYVSSSSNGGASWTAPHPVTPPDLPDNQGSFPGVGPNGELYVAYENFDTPTLNVNQILVSKSTDGGATFSRPVKVDAVFDICPRIVFGSCSLLNSSFRVNSLPSLAVDQHNGRVYVTWGDYRTGDADVLATSSPDGSRWRGPVRVNDDRGDADQFFPAVAVTPSGAVSIAYYDRRNDPANFLIDTYVSTAPGGSLNFHKSARATTDSFDPDADPGFGGAFLGDYIGNTASRHAAHPIWTDTRPLGFPEPNQDAVTATVFLSKGAAQP
jgi:hypothetical protein